MEEDKQIFSKKAGLNSNLIVPIIVVVLVTGLAVWMVPEDEEPKKQPLPSLGSGSVVRPLDSQDSADKPAIKPLTKKESTAAQAGDSKALADRDIPSPAEEMAEDARTIIKKLRNEGGNTAKQAFEAAGQKHLSGNNEDAYILYLFAARQGHGEAAYILGTNADPAYFSSSSSVLDSPDLAQAIKWYKLAIDAGNKEAKKSLADLAERIQEQAAAGNSEAQRLMLQLR